jgi:hypothetical protein
MHTPTPTANKTQPIFFRQCRETGEVSPVSEQALKRYLEAHRTPAAFAIREIAGGMVLETTWFNYAAQPAAFKAVPRPPELVTAR